MSFLIALAMLAAAWYVLCMASFGAILSVDHLMSLPARKRAAAEADKALRIAAAKRRERAEFIRSLPKTKSGELFPAGRKALAKFEEAL